MTREQWHEIVMTLLACIVVGIAVVAVIHLDEKQAARPVCEYEVWHIYTAHGVITVSGEICRQHGGKP